MSNQSVPHLRISTHLHGLGLALDDSLSSSADEIALQSEFPISTPVLRKTIRPPLSRVNLISPQIAGLEGLLRTRSRRHIRCSKSEFLEKAEEELDSVFFGLLARLSGPHEFLLELPMEKLSCASVLFRIAGERITCRVSSDGQKQLN
jgi:hypothetical protein